MRQLIVQVPQGQGKEVLTLAQQHQGTNLAQIEASDGDRPLDLRSSLVSGAATGMLVAASLAPPAGIVGMAIAIGRWDMVTGGVFLLLLQLCGINLAAALLFRGVGLSTQGARYSRGKKAVFPIALLITRIAEQNTLLTVLYVQRSPDATESDAAIRDRLTETIQARLAQQYGNVTPLVSVNVLAPPGQN